MSTGKLRCGKLWGIVLKGLKIPVSAVQFCVSAPEKSRTYVTWRKSFFVQLEFWYTPGTLF